MDANIITAAPPGLKSRGHAQQAHLRIGAGVGPQTVSKDNSLGSPQTPTFMLTQKISGIAAGATPSRAKK